MKVVLLIFTRRVEVITIFFWQLEVHVIVRDLGRIATATCQNIISFCQIEDWWQVHIHLIAVALHKAIVHVCIDLDILVQAHGLAELDALLDVLIDFILFSNVYLVFLQGLFSMKVLLQGFVYKEVDFAVQAPALPIYQHRTVFLIQVVRLVRYAVLLKPILQRLHLKLVVLHPVEVADIFDLVGLDFVLLCCGGWGLGGRHLISIEHLPR